MRYEINIIGPDNKVDGDNEIGLHVVINGYIGAQAQLDIVEAIIEGLGYRSLEAFVRFLLGLKINKIANIDKSTVEIDVAEFNSQAGADEDRRP